MTEKITTVLFDLDGTLLPFDQEEFIHSYFKRLAIKLIPMGFEKDSLMKAIWTGMEAMTRNDGTKTNEVAFWEVFEGLLHTKRELLEDVFRDFYLNEFDGVRSS